MGLSISAATAVIFIAAVLAFTALFSAVTQAQNDLFEAHRDYLDRQDEKQLTRLSITEIVYAGEGNWTISIANEGTVTLDVRDVDLLINGFLSTDQIGEIKVNGLTGTNIWMPGEEMEISVASDLQGAAIGIVAGNGSATYIGGSE